MAETSGWGEDEDFAVPFERAEDDEIRRLVRQLIDADWGAWRRADLERVWARLGWTWHSAQPDDPDLSWSEYPYVSRLVAADWPLGLATAYAPKADPGQFHMLEISLTSDGDLLDQVHGWRDVWPVAADVLGPAAMWGGAGPWGLWRRPDTALVVGVHFGDVVVQVWRGDRDASTDSWRAAAPADLPPEAGPTTPVTWDDLERELARALEDLIEDASWFPAQFILHLQSGRDPRRLVQAWNEGADLKIEATGFLHYPESADLDALSALGWPGEIRKGQRLFPGALNNAGEDAATAAHMLVDALRRLQVEPAELTYDGELTRRDGKLHLDLPRLGIARGDADA